MRILAISYVFPNSVYPNAGVFVLNRLRAIHRYHEVKVINPIPWFPWNSRLQRYCEYHLIPRQELIGGIEVQHPRFFSVPRILKGLDSVTYSRQVLRAARRIGENWPYDLIDLHWTYPDLPAGALLSRVQAVRHLVTVRGHEALYPNDFAVRGRMVRHLLSRADSVIALSPALAMACVSAGVSRDRISVIGNGVDRERFRILDGEECRRRLELPAKNRVLLAVGSVTPVKGFDRLIMCLPDVLVRFPDVMLYIVGPQGAAAGGDVSESLKRLVHDLGLAEKVRFWGEAANENLPLWYNAADLFCLSSRSEGWPNVLMEALACGCPAVATRVGSVPTLLDKESLGVLVPNEDGSLAAGICAALSRQYDRKAIATRMEQFDWDQCAKEVIRVYEEVLGNAGDSSKAHASVVM